MAWPSSRFSGVSPGHRKRRSAAEADVHSSVFRKDDLSSLPKKVVIDGTATTVGTHEDAMGVRAKGNAHNQADEFEACGASSGRTCISDVPPSAASNQGQTHRSPG